ncbi:MAG TPA: hypothetical protein VNX21_00895, partial [Candidatus Thermoplasmatota archaeon]|nr:hypothetical protein [Candidatus Thermoplasmatota archaeon]
MRIALVLLALTTATLVPPTATAGHLCNGTVTAVSHTTTSSGGTLSIRVVFEGDGPGYIPGECDIGWVTTCRLVVNLQEVQNATCAHTNGDDRCHEVSSPYVCEVALTGSLQALPGVYTIQATLGMTWG